ncbi:hypothetical protein PPACK8108_LOCUS25757 [Phakopsora pachyrhizi]|uniref:Uncharacterized protein n=1 Tax=Phakopsora pachyrhizi TaxID=170000 RepID=A0AAV0BWC5_PHAPC|nr:hypothetical protein PPACK8108_LOCUS25757 [Phakopsora pachyrhizi]
MPKPNFRSANLNAAHLEEYQPLQPVNNYHQSSKAGPSLSENQIGHSFDYNSIQSEVQSRLQFSDVNYERQISDYFDDLTRLPRQLNTKGTQDPQASFESEPKSLSDESRRFFYKQDGENPQYAKKLKDISVSKKNNLIKKRTKTSTEVNNDTNKYKKPKILPPVSSGLLTWKDIRAKDMQLKNLEEHNSQINLLEVMWSHNGSPLNINFFKRIENILQNIEIKEVRGAVTYLFSRVTKFMESLKSENFFIEPENLVEFLPTISNQKYGNIEELSFKKYYPQVTNYSYNKFGMLTYLIKKSSSTGFYNKFFPNEYYASTEKLLKILERQEKKTTKKRAKALKNRKNFILSIRKTLFLITKVINRVLINKDHELSFHQKQMEALEIFDEVFQKIDLSCIRSSTHNTEDKMALKSVKTESPDYLGRQLSINISRGWKGSADLE